MFLMLCARSSGEGGSTAGETQGSDVSTDNAADEEQERDGPKTNVGPAVILEASCWLMFVCRGVASDVTC